MANSSNGDVATKFTGDDRRTLDAIFEHPTASDIHWMAVLSLVESVGKTKMLADDRYSFEIGRKVQEFDRPHTKALTEPEVLQLRAFFKASGIMPNDAEPSHHSDDGAGLEDAVVVVERRSARIWALPDGDDAQALEPYDPGGRLHHGDEIDVGEENLLQRLVEALAQARRILIVSHGEGAGRTASQLESQLRDAHGQTYARVVKTVAAGSATQSPGDLLALARTQFAQFGAG